MVHSGINLVTTVTKTSGVSEHPVTGVVNPDGSAYIHLIPKNSSSYLRTWLKKEQWVELTMSDHILNRPHKIHQLAIIRDPMDRWLSGITQFLFDVFHSLNPIENHWEAIFRIITAQPNQDAHTTPQAEFFYNYTIDHFDFLYLEDFASNKNKIKDWAIKSNQKFAYLDSTAPNNQTREEKIKTSILDFLKINLNNNTEFKQKIINYYEVDYKLIKWIGNNNKWIQ